MIFLSLATLLSPDWYIEVVSSSLSRSMTSFFWKRKRQQLFRKTYMPRPRPKRIIKPQWSTSRVYNGQIIPDFCWLKCKINKWKKWNKHNTWNWRKYFYKVVCLTKFYSHINQFKVNCFFHFKIENISNT